MLIFPERAIVIDSTRKREIRAEIAVLPELRGTFRHHSPDRSGDCPQRRYFDEERVVVSLHKRLSARKFTGFCKLRFSRNRQAS
ncbi:hypothetical protein [Novosphingobium olei]|uniref:hypothetical protein n=1 Tax=Novosphingobium olei TaxID=2728851 RepID=UPI00308963E2|nr:hypothetical protein NSDW_22240 [Novosphingobium olei]